MKSRKDKNQPVTTGEFQEFKGDFQKLSSEVKDLSSEVKDLSSEVKDLSSEVKQSTNDFHEFADFIINTAATKEDLKQLKNELTTSEVIRTIVREEVRPMKEDLEEKITEFKSEILNHIDAAMGELKDTRQEQVMDAGHHHRTDQKLEAHEKRITRLEVKVGVA